MDSDDEAIRMCLLDDGVSNSARSQSRYLDDLCSQDFKSCQELIRRLKKQSIDADLSDLDFACKRGLPKAVKTLLKEETNVNKVNKNHLQGPIHFATENGHKDVIEVLLNDENINPNLEAGGQTALHMAVKENDLTIARLLLEKGASPNVSNNKGETALHMAARRDQRDMVELILDRSKHALQLDIYKDRNGRTTREILREKMPDLPLPAVQKNHVDVHGLKYFLYVNDEINFYNCLQTIPSDVVNKVIVELIELAVERKLRRTVSLLLERIEGTKCDLTRTAILAIRAGSPEILHRVLNTSNVVESSDLLLTACQVLGMPGNSRTMSDRLKCLKLCLQWSPDVKCTDSKGNTPLHYAARAECQDAVSLLLKEGSYIGHGNNFGIPPLAHIRESTLSEHFDKCIEITKKEWNGYTIEFDYECLVQNGSSTEKKSEMNVFQYIADNNGLKHLLKHPLLSLFLYLKWRSIRWIFYLNLIFYVLLCIPLYTHIYNTHIDARSSNSSSEQATNAEPNESPFKWISVFFLVILSLKEALLISFSPCDYLKTFNVDKLLKISLIVFGFSALFTARIDIVVLAILSSAWKLVFEIGQQPWMSNDIEIFKKVFVNFMRLFCLYTLPIFAFAVAFNVLFKGNDDFLGFGQSLFKTIIMLTGEFDADDIPFVSNPILSRLIFTLFVFLIAIVLLNLLNGLAVSDTTAILSKAELVTLITRTRLIADVEKMVFQAHSPIRNCYSLNCLTERVNLFLRYFESDDLPSKLTFRYDNLREAYIHETTDEVLIKVKKSFNNRVFLDIMKQAKEIVSRRSQESELEKISRRLTSMEDTLNNLTQAIGNNNGNVENRDGPGEI